MAKVSNHNGDNHSTSEGMTYYRYSGTPTDQYEHIPTIGEQRVMKVAVVCVGTGLDQVADGVRHISKWRVTNTEIGEAVEPVADPQLEFGDEGSGEYGDYTGSEDTGGTVVTAQFSDPS